MIVECYKIVLKYPIVRERCRNSIIFQRPNIFKSWKFSFYFEFLFPIKNFKGSKSFIFEEISLDTISIIPFDANFDLTLEYFELSTYATGALRTRISDAA